MWSTLLLEKAGRRRIEILKEFWERKDVSRSAFQQHVLGDRQICYQAQVTAHLLYQAAWVTPATV